MNATSEMDPLIQEMDLEDKSLKELMSITFDFFDRNQNEFAYTLLTYVLQRFPEESNLNDFLGVVLRRLNRHSEAEDAFIRVLEQDPDNTSVLFLMSSYLMERYEFEMAEEFIARAIENATDDQRESYFLMRGLIRLLAGRDGVEEDLLKCRNIFDSEEELKKLLEAVKGCRKCITEAGVE